MAVQASREVRTVIGRLRRRILNAAEAEDITFGQESVPTRLSGEQGVTASQLASAEGVRHQSMTATVTSLTALGLVERRPDPDDGRRLLIVLTAQGHQRVAEGRQTRQEWLAGEFQEKCTEEERRAVIAAMSVLERLTCD
ncbi:MarR family transcriptional regulator [Streptomyces laculatispora]|uniref:MarR family transcriptional regulator n=1 Tax=Streptomyces laculatispora TaxID=887464 RepID=A0ABY9ID34_9ACTN|nr:MarR family transcriptional regulator [Streptomyces laculatispora]WLQ44807.1 MarR family transcriptional regulator [Streptomyces laculatispora]